MTTGEITVLLIGGHTLSRYGLRAALQSQPGIKVIAEADCAAAGLEVIARRRPDVAVLDTVHSGRQACHITRALIDMNPAPAVLVVVNEICHHTSRVLAVGARGVILKHVEPLELAGAVRSVASGYAIMPDAIIRPLYAAKCLPRKSCDRGKLESLSARELEVLRWVITGDSNAQIAQRLHITDGTVKCHIQHVLNKLGLPDRVHAVIYAYEAGFMDRAGGFTKGTAPANGSQRLPGSLKPQMPKREAANEPGIAS